MTKPRLIDANELKDIIDGSEEFIDWQKREICECIDCCDTAYDIDKVVKDVSEVAYRIHNYCEEIDLNIPEEERTGYKMLPDIEKLIEIVEKGGNE